MMDYIFHSNVINFVLVLAFFIWLLFFKMDVVGFFEKKSQEVLATIQKSENKKADAIAKLAETKDSLKNVNNDIEKIVADAKAVAETIREKAETKLQDELKMLATREQVLKEAHESKAQDEVSKNITNAALAVSKEYLKNSLDEQTHRELIYDFINKLESMRVE